MRSCQRAEVSQAERPTFSQENFSGRISPWMPQPSPGDFSSEQKPSLQWTLFHPYQSALLHSAPPSKDLGTPKPSGAPEQPQGWTCETLQLYLGVLGTPELSHVNHTHTHCVYSGDNSKTDKTCNCSFRVTRKVQDIGLGSYHIRMHQYLHFFKIHKTSEKPNPLCKLFLQISPTSDYQVKFKNGEQNKRQNETVFSWKDNPEFYYPLQCNKWGAGGHVHGLQSSWGDT